MYGKTISFVAITFLWKAIAISCVHAQEMPDGNPQLLLSKGLTIHKIDNPEKLPRTFREIRSDKNLLPVAAGRFMMRFPMHKLRAGRGMRHLVLTESGSWGYLKLDEGQRTYAGEDRLRHFADSRSFYGILLHNHNYLLPISDKKIPITLGRGEIYEIIGFPDNVNSDSNNYVIRLSDDKSADIKAQAKTLKLEKETLPKTLIVPEKKIQFIDIVQLLPEGVKFSKKSKNKRSEYKKIYFAWNKYRIQPRAKFAKNCGENVAWQVKKGKKKGVVFALDIGLKKTINIIKTKLDTKGNYSNEIAQEVIKILKLDKNLGIRANTWLFDMGGTEKPYFVRLVGSCGKFSNWHEIDMPANRSGN
ncbi:MAG: hypothetical protein HOM58_04210 [Rhodospirillaceae bacterium]|jgi:hypothetical protein|nr:hypothetical protein [Rhodospirillaceae bacterium]